MPNKLRGHFAENYSGLKQGREKGIIEGGKKGAKRLNSYPRTASAPEALKFEVSLLPSDTHASEFPGQFGGRLHIFKTILPSSCCITKAPRKDTNKYKSRTMILTKRKFGS